MNQVEYHQFSRFFIPLNHHGSELHPIKPPFPMVKSALNIRPWSATRSECSEPPSWRIWGPKLQRRCGKWRLRNLGHHMYVLYIYIYTYIHIIYIYNIHIYIYIHMCLLLLYYYCYYFDDYYYEYCCYYSILQQDPMAWKEERCSNMILMLTCVHHVGMYIYPQHPSANRCMEHHEFLGSTFGQKPHGFPTASRSLRRWRAVGTNHCCISIWISMSWTLQSFLMCSLARQPLDHESTNCIKLP